MTNPTPHGQVPEALIDLIDAYAETRHRCGGIYNAKTEAARKAVIEALSGVQALSAAPAGWKLVPENATDAMVFAGCTVDNATHMKIENSILKTKVWAAMLEAAPKAAPGELHDHQILAITTAYEQGVGKGRQAHESGKEIANPYGTGYRCDLAWQYGYKEGKEQAERIAKAAPTPPAEQQAKDNYIKLLADCRDAFPVPEHGSPIENEWIAAVGSHEAVPAYLQAVAKQQAITPETGNSVSAQGAAITSESGAVYAELPQPDSWFHFTPQYWENTLRDFADRTYALRMGQAAPKAAPTLPEGWTDCTIEFGNDGPEVVAYGPKRMMNRLAKWLGKYFARVIADATPKAAPGEPSWWRKRADEIEAQVALTGSPEAMRCYTDMRTLLQAVADAAPQQEAQEPVAWDGAEEWEKLAWHLCAEENGEDACNELIWEGGPMPEPWGERWLKYEGEARRMIALVRTHVPAPQQEAQEPCPSCKNSDIYACTCPFQTSRNAAPQPAPAPLSDDVVRDAARWRWLSEHIGVAWDEGKFTSLVRIVSDKNRTALNASIDRMMAGDWSYAALAAQGGTP